MHLKVDKHMQVIYDTKGQTPLIISLYLLYNVLLNTYILYLLEIYGINANIGSLTIKSIV